MVGTGEIVAERFGAVLAEEHGTGVLHAVEVVERVVQTQLQMLGRDGVGNVDRLRDAVDEQDRAVMLDRIAGDLAAFELRDLPLELRRDALCERLAVRQQDRAREPVVLRL